MIRIKIDHNFLATLLPQFSLDACKAICDFYEEVGCDGALYLGDIAIGFSEIEKEDLEDWEEVIAELPNGNYLVLN